MSLARRIYGMRHSVARARESARVLGALPTAAAAHGTSIPRALARVWRLNRRFGFAPGEAVGCGLIARDSPAVPRMLAKRETLRIQRRINPVAMEPVTEDKVVFDAFCRAAGLPVPRVVGVLQRDGLGYMEGHDGPLGIPRWHEALGRLDGEFVIKPVHGSHGTDVRSVVSREGCFRDLVGGDTSPRALADALAARPVHAWLVQERLRNHPAFDGIGADTALHTVRMVTLIEDGAPRLLYGVLRIATRGVVDNFADGERGTILCALDPATGAVTRASGHDTGVLRDLPTHPSGRPWTDWPVPDWERAVELVTRAADAFRPLRTIGWDVGLTPTGPVLVEANMWWDNTVVLPLREMLPAELYRP